MMREKLKAFVADPLRSENADVASRIYSDASLWNEFEDALYPGAEPTEKERFTIARVVADHCPSDLAHRNARLQDFVARRLDKIFWNMRDFALAAARRDGTDEAETQKNLAEDVTFVFVSCVDRNSSGESVPWRAEMTLPADAAVTEMLQIVITGVREELLDGGFFKVAGVSLPVVRGLAEIPYGIFLSGLKDAAVAFVDARGKVTPGTLALF